MGANSDRPELERPASIETRYQIERTLGQGANGVVYQVLDRESGERLALKKLLRMDRLSVSRLKHEFRALANLHHPNLVKLYEMARAEDAWFITMEHLAGTDLVTHLGREADISSTVSLGRPIGNDSAAQTLAALSNAFLQLSRGIHALHRAGMLHRDLKPSNVMVVRDRVVVLDFGLVHELGDRSATMTQEEGAAGTPAYMSPEQVQGETLSAASDWYAFGVMLYEAVSGKLPISGRLLELLDKKIHSDPTPLRELLPDCPAALSDLCAGLLSRNPQKRPGFESISSVLQSLMPTQPAHVMNLDASEAERLSIPQRSSRPELVGRAQELSELASIFQEALRGKLAVASVLGPSGAGKSALVEHFLESLEVGAPVAAARNVLVLRARCYEREAMPFKALDGVMEALVRHLLRQDELLVSHMLPVHVPELARAFPALERLPSVQRLLAQSPPLGAAARERSRAEQALSELLRRVATHNALVLSIDDLQWGDLDSVRILKSWIESEPSLPMMLVLAYRGEEREDNACLKLLASSEPGSHAVQHELEVSPLSTADVESLCRNTLGSLAPRHASLMRRIVEEAHGSPYLAWQLLTLAQAQIAQGETDLTLSLGGLVSQLSGLLREPERALLNVLAVAGRPIAGKLALQAARIRQKGRSQLHALQGLGLIRMRVVHGARLIELYHDRVRESVVEALSESERIDTHRRLLAALELAEEKVDPDWLHVVAVGAGDDEAAVRYGLAAAQRAEASFAFERASELYRECLQRDAVAAASSELWQKLGDALVACGRGARAAEAYLAAAQRSQPDEAIDLTRLAASHLIRTGRFEQGEALVRQALEQLNISVPQSTAGLMAAIAWERTRLALRGLDIDVTRADAQRDRLLLREAHTYATLSIDTQSYHPLRAALFEARALRIALDSNAPAQVALALCAAATVRGVSGTERAGDEAEKLILRAEHLAKGLNDQVLLARVESARAMCAFLLGRTKQVVEISERAERMFQSSAQVSGRMPAEYYHRFAVNAARIGALFQLGQFQKASHELRAALQEARNTENRTAQLHLTMVLGMDEIAQGRAARARARLDTERPQLPQSGFGPLHLLHMVAVIRVGCTLGDHAWVNQVLARMWPSFERSFLRHGVLAQLAYGAHARLMLNQHVRERRKGDIRRVIEKDLQAMRNVPKHLQPAMHTRMQARLAYLEGAAREQVATLYRAHVQAAELAGYADEVIRGRWALGRVLADAEGAALCRDAERDLHAIGFAEPPRELESHFPELA